MKRIGLLAFLVVICLSFVTPSAAQGESPISVQSSSAVVDFPTRITFKIAAKSGASINDIRLRYEIERESFALVIGESFVEFSPSASVSASWIMDMLKTGGLPTGAGLRYWWIIKDASGARLETQPQQVTVADNRYQWRSITQGNVSLHWYQGDSGFATQLMNSAQQALTRLDKDTGAKLSLPIDLYIYNGSQDLQGSMIFPTEWTGGVSFTEFGIITLGIAPSNIAWGLRSVAHELTHLAVHQMTFNPYNGLPTWLDEGIAVYNEGPADPTFAGLLKNAIAQDKTITLQSLTSPFSAYGDEATLSYSESYSVVNYLITTYGQQKMLDLLNTFRQGSGYEDAFQAVYGFNMDGLYSQWKSKVQSSSRTTSLPPESASLAGLDIAA